MKLNLVFLYSLTFTLVLTVEILRAGSDLDESQISVESDTDIQRNTLEKLWRAMKYRLGQNEQDINSQPDNEPNIREDNRKENQIKGQSDKEKELTENDLEKISEETTLKPMNEAIEQNTNETEHKIPVLEDRPNQMAPIAKALLYIRPKRDERWVMLEEGLIKWAISSYLQPYASEILMNCNLYRDGNMILSVFRGVPLSVGTESWTPPGFLEPAPNYQLRLWNQPSRIGLIDEYSALFSIVPSADDAFMFDSNPKQLIGDTLKDSGMYKESKHNEDDSYRSTTTTEPAKKITTITPKFMPGYNVNTLLPGVHNPGSNINLINQKQGSSGTNAIAPNMPTGIYALYPSLSIKLLPTFVYGFWCSIVLAIYLFIN